VPLYDYRCKACNHQFEALVLRGKEPVCAKCRGGDLERLLSLPAIKSDDTRARSMAAAKKRDKAQGKDRMHEQEKYEKSHND
jgi:putative FmdB family regulatory protein